MPLPSSLRITPINHALNATVRVPGSKSLTNRALLIASLANGTTRLTNTLFSDDSRYFAKALQTLGFDVQLSPWLLPIALLTAASMAGLSLLML